MLNIGSKAPEFELINQDKSPVKLTDFKGRKLVLYFYPKDCTPGCTTQAIEFSESINDFKRLNVEIIGISKDSVRSHKHFQEKHKLKITLLSDETLKVCQSYGVWREKKL